MALFYIIFIYFFNYFTIRVGVSNCKKQDKPFITSFSKKILGIDIFYIEGTVIYRILYIINLLLFSVEIVLYILKFVEIYRVMSVISSVLYLVILVVNVIYNIYNQHNFDFGKE